MNRTDLKARIQKPEARIQKKVGMPDILTSDFCLLTSVFMWAGTELNRRHVDFQSTALPTELPALKVCGTIKD